MKKYKRFEETVLPDDHFKIYLGFYAEKRRKDVLPYKPDKPYPQTIWTEVSGPYFHENKLNKRKQKLKEFIHYQLFELNKSYDEGFEKAWEFFLKDLNDMDIWD